MHAVRGYLNVQPNNKGELLWIIQIFSNRAPSVGSFRTAEKWDALLLRQCLYNNSAAPWAWLPVNLRDEISSKCISALLVQQSQYTGCILSQAAEPDPIPLSFVLPTGWWGQSECHRGWPHRAIDPWAKLTETSPELSAHLHWHGTAVTPCSSPR